MDWEKSFPIMIVDDALQAENAEGKMLREIILEIENKGTPVIQATSVEDGCNLFISQPEICCIFLDWDLKGKPGPDKLVKLVRNRNQLIPLFLLTEKLTVKDIPLEVIDKITGYIWKIEDTPDFIAGRIEQEVKKYLESLMPPFFKELVSYVDECKYSWHTPGHMGGVAFLKSPVGRIFFEFLGENTLRSDLSISVPELGSLLEHSGVVGKSEKRAARTFGSDMSFFVTNGTSTANKIVFQSCVTSGDIVLVDRNCHKSIVHSVIMTGAIPIYFIPTRNSYGIIGPIHPEEFNQETIKKKISLCPLIKNYDDKKIKLAIITNSTYDGLCYNVSHIKSKLFPGVDYLHFDEAWYAYARFHPLYENRYAMHDEPDIDEMPTVFATQSTHKVLAALSQASMIHIKNGINPVEHDRFNETYMMHTSTSPQYLVIASLDVAARMMEHNAGKLLINETIEEAIIFREKMILIKEEIKKKNCCKDEKWWFNVWQSEELNELYKTSHFNSKLELKDFCKNQKHWVLKPGDKWHGFPGLIDGYTLLDPIKVTILTPGIDCEGEMKEWGIPACIVSRYLRNKGIVVEKTGHYSFLILYTIGITKGKSGTLLSLLFDFKRHFDKNSPLDEVFPELTEGNAGIYSDLGLNDLCRLMHQHLKKENITRILSDITSVLPKQAIMPTEAYERLVRGDVKRVKIRELKGRISAVMIVPYPPGIPLVMPGERLTDETERIIDFLTFCEEFDIKFPGFENEVHGIVIDNEKRYSAYCIE